MAQTTMKAKDISIVFFGSGPLAAESLAFLHDTFTIEAVITKPRAAHHKGVVPVISFCEENDLNYYTPSNKMELTELFQHTHFRSSFGVVIDYGIIIAREVIDAFALGIVNSHFSLLPEWRGADPITFAVLSGQTQTGVSLMLINEKMDEGPILAQAAVAITASTNSVSLTSELVELSNALLLEILPLYAAGQIQPVPQSNTIGDTHEPTYSRKLTKQDGHLDWEKPAEQLEREIRAFIEWPKSRATFGQIDAIVTDAKVLDSQNGIAGNMELDSATNQLIVTCGSGRLVINRLKPAGKKEMIAADFIRGYASRIT